VVANDSDVTGSGGGAINGTLHGGTVVQSPPKVPCAQYTGPLVYDSGPAYEGTYGVTDPVTGVVTHKYAGPLTVHYEISGTTYQNATGSFGPPDASGNYCPGTPGYVYHSVTGRADGTNPVTGEKVECDFNSGAYRRIATTIDVELRGDPSVTGMGCSFYNPTTGTWSTRFLVHQKHINEQAFTGPAPSTSTGSETYETCLPAVCVMT
jgi:hypothetical protein